MSAFDNIQEDEKLHISENFYIIEDQYPVSPGHLLIISKSSKSDYFNLDENEKKELTELIDIAKGLIESKHQPNGFNIGMNCGTDAGQTIMHFHCHIIPRYKGDVDDPTGGVRNVIPGKGKY